MEVIIAIVIIGFLIGVLIHPKVWDVVNKLRSRKEWHEFEQVETDFTHLYRVVRVRYASGAEDVYRYVSNDYRENMWYLEVVDYTEPHLRKYDDGFGVSFSDSIRKGINRDHIEELEYEQQWTIEGTVTASGRWREDTYGNTVEIDESTTRIDTVIYSPDY